MAGNFTINVVVSGGGAGTGGGTGGGQGGGTNGIATAVAGVAGLQALNAANATPAISKDLTVAQGFIFNQREMLTKLNQRRQAEGFAPYSRLLQNPKTGAFVAMATSVRENMSIGSGGGVVGTKILDYQQTISGRKPYFYKGKSFFRRETWRQDLTGTSVRFEGDGYQITNDIPTDPLYYEYGTAGYQDIIPNIGKHFATHYKKYGAVAAITAVKAIQSAINITKHQSGDSYANQQLDNSVRLATSIGAITYAAATNPVILAGLVINEAANILVSRANFEFDRKMERYEITNNMIAAGNASYGRMRGIGV